MGGKIWVESLGNVAGNPPENWVFNPENTQIQGSIFHFTFITKEVLASSLTAKYAHENEKKEGETDKIYLKILLAEDNKVNQKVALMTLKKLGYTADIANNGLEVLAMIENQLYDVILMDMQMPEMDGITATKMIREANISQPWIIALTANALVQDRQICLDAGMNDFLAKPLVITELTEALKKLP
jgi:CheY-like chemotaxis protein